MSQNNRTLLLKKNLLEFYDKKSNMDTIVNIVNKKTQYSLRLLEWFCSNYAKKNNIIYPLSKTKDFNVYFSYKLQLDSYQKKQFDPFKRNHAGYGKFEVEYADGKTFETTVCQLNFFRWVLENKILDYIKENIGKIKDDMNTCVNYSTDPKTVKARSVEGPSATSQVPQTKKSRKKRQPLSASATMTCLKRYKTVVIKF